MGMQIMNGGIEAGILRLVSKDGTPLSEIDQKRLDYLESLPRNVMIDLDYNGMAITKEQAICNAKEDLSHYGIIK